MQPRAWLWRIPSVLLAVAACRPAVRAPAQQAVSEGAVPLERVLSAAVSGLTEARRLVVRDAARWNALWPAIVGQQRPAPPPASVDFAASMLIVAAMGQRGTGGYEIHVERVTEREGALEVIVKEISPGEGCWLTQAMTAPVEIVKLARHDGPVAFVEERERRDCT